MPIIQVSLGCVIGSFFPWWTSTLFGVGFLIARGIMSGGFLGKNWVWVGFLLISGRMLFVPGSLPEDHVSVLNGQEVTLRTVMTSDIVMKPEAANVVAEVEGYCGGDCDDGGDWQDASGKVQTWLPRFPRVAEGDVVILKGRLEEPEDFTDEFSYVDFLRSKDIYSVMYRPNVRMTDERTISVIKKILFNFRDSCIGKVNSLLPEPHASLLAGMLFGVKRGMPQEFADALRRTGTTHIIAASGYNVTLVIQAVVSVLAFLQRRMRLLVSIGAVWCFVLLAGASPPVVRAGIMGTFTLVGVLLGSAATVHIGLPLSAAIMVIATPEVITDVGFQLSFLSSFGLVYGVPVIKRFLGWIPEWLEESTTVTMAAFIMTAPLIAYHFGSVSILAILVNFLVIPTISYVMVLGVILLVVPVGMSLVSTIISCLIWVPLEYFISVVDLFAKVPFASVMVGKGNVLVLVASYILIVFLLIRCFPAKSDEENYLGL